MAVAHTLQSRLRLSEGKYSSKNKVSSLLISLLSADVEDAFVPADSATHNMRYISE